MREVIGRYDESLIDSLRNASNLGNYWRSFRGIPYLHDDSTQVLISYDRFEPPFFLDALENFFREAFPPANSAFSVLLARCFVRSSFLASLVSYRIFFDFDFFFKVASRDGFVGFISIGGGWRVAGSVLMRGPWMNESGSKSSTTVTVARISSSSYSSSLCLPFSSEGPEIPAHTPSSPFPAQPRVGSVFGGEHQYNSPSNAP